MQLRTILILFLATTAVVLGQTDLSVGAQAGVPSGNTAAAAGVGSGEQVDAGAATQVDDTSATAFSIVTAVGGAVDDTSDPTGEPDHEFDLDSLLGFIEKVHGPSCLDVEVCEEIADYEHCGFCIATKDSKMEIDPYTYADDYETFPSYYYTTWKYNESAAGGWYKKRFIGKYVQVDVPKTECDGVFITSAEDCPVPTCEQTLACLFKCDKAEQDDGSDSIVLPVTETCLTECKADIPYLKKCGYDIKMEKMGKIGKKYAGVYLLHMFNITLPHDGKYADFFKQYLGF